MFCIEGTDETLDQNKAEVLNTMIGYFNGQITGQMNPKTNPEAED